MSDNVTKVEFGGKGRKARNLRPLFSLLGILVLVLLAVGIVLFRDQLNVDKIRRYFTYMGNSADENYGVYLFDAHSGNTYASFESGMALASVGGLTLWDEEGNRIQTVQGALKSPAVRVGGKLVMAFDVGGNTVLAASSKDGEVLNVTANTVLDADISDTDEICYVSVEDGYKSVLTVLSSHQTETYKWYSSTQYMPVCAISNNGTYLAAVALGQNDGSFESTAQIFKTDQEDVYQSVSLGNQLILDLAYLSENRLCAIGESEILFFDVEGQLSGAYDLENQYLSGYDLGGDGFLVLSRNQYKAGNRYSIVTVDSAGNQIAELYIGKEILDISACGNYVAVLTSEELTIYNKNLEIYHVKENIDAASRVLMRKDGSAILIGGGEAKLYLP